MRLYAKDVRDILLNFLRSNLNNKIEELRAKYNIVDLCKIKSFNNVLDYAFLPVLIVTVNSGKQVEDRKNNNAELYNVTIEIYVKEIDFNVLQDILDCYEEAIKSLLNYAIEEFTYIRYIDHNKGFLVEEKKGTTWSGIMFNFEVRVN